MRPRSGCWKALSCPTEAQILGPQIVREITYRVLCGPRGGSLRALIAINGRLSQIQRALEHMHAKYAEVIDVASLAEETGMSVSAFHHNFKSVTANSPLQYLKTIRLHKARMLMAVEGLNAGGAADRTGYQSASQFSREFKRFFGATPHEEATFVRRMLGLDRRRSSVSSENCRQAPGVRNGFSKAAELLLFGPYRAALAVSKTPGVAPGKLVASSEPLGIKR